jgi:hypothetical protein
MGENAIASSRRTDDQLLFITDQTAEWTVHGRGGVELGLFASLREALRAVFRLEANGVHVFAVCRQPDEDVVVFREQMERLADADGTFYVAPQPARHVWPAASDVHRHRIGRLREVVPAGRITL